MLSYGILGALVARERYGYGQKVDVSHLGSMNVDTRNAEWNQPAG